MSWRNEVRKQINKAKSRREENRITTKIVESNKKTHIKEAKERESLRISLQYEFNCD